MEAIVVGIDGTGELWNAAYRAGMRNSFVSYICRRTPARMKKYFRGPFLDGLDMGIIVEKAYNFVRESRVALPQAPVVLTGYSRGGAGVIAVAGRLAADDVEVNGMVLFDAVDRSLAINSTVVSANVKRLVAARRDARAVSRTSFGNCGTIWAEPPTRSSIRSFWGTHGALGGVPWPAPPGAKATDTISEGFFDVKGTKVSYVQDARCSQEVWAWVSPQLTALGLFGGTASNRAKV